MCGGYSKATTEEIQALADISDADFEAQVEQAKAEPVVQEMAAEMHATSSFTSLSMQARANMEYQRRGGSLPETRAWGAVPEAIDRLRMATHA